MGRVTDTISGSLATFRTPGKQRIRSLKAYFTPKQEGSGTPSPDNVRPITGWTGCEVYRTGKNLCPAATSAEMYENWEYYDSGRNYIVHGLPAGQAMTLQTNVLVDRGENISNLRLYLRGADYGFINTATPSGVGTLTRHVANDGTIRISHNNLGLSPTSYNVQLADTQLEVGSTATSYEPYQGTTLPIDWSSAGTVYGGYVDLVTGEVWETWKYIDLTTADWTQFSVGSTVLTVSLFPGTISSRNNAFCNILPMVSNPNVSGVEGVDWNGGRMNLCLSVSRNITTLAEFKVWLESLKSDGATPCVVANLATPTLVTTLTPTALRTLIGTNNIWCNSGDVSVEYDFAESMEMQEARKRVMAFDAANRLPSAYQKVEYIQSDSAYAMYIDTGVPIASDVEMEMQISVPSVTSRKYLLGRYIDNSAGDFYLYTSSGSTIYFQTAYGCTYNNTSKTCDTSKHTFRFNITNDTAYVYCDGTDVLHKTILRTITERPILVAGTSMGAERLSCNTYWVRISKGGALIRNLIPCVRKSDNKPGMYDTVSKTFYTNSGTGEFIVPT